MNLENRIAVLVALGQRLVAANEQHGAVYELAYIKNKWFTVENIENATNSLATQMLTREKLENWVAHYHISEPVEVKTVAIVMAGNIPLVGFHDFLSIFVSGHLAQIKLSEKDEVLFPHILKLMVDINPEVELYIKTTDRLANFDAVIATGSNNTARYFEQYFGKYPNIIRKNRQSIGILNGNETKEEIMALGQDIFAYFGLGCRNISKIYLPKGYDIVKIMEPLHEYNDLVNHDKYKNNFDYNIALFMLNRLNFYNNGCLILLEDERLVSRISSVNFEYYEDINAVIEKINNQKEDIQCIVSQEVINGLGTVRFGETQKPTLFDYPDGIDVMQFLLSIS